MTSSALTGNTVSLTIGDGESQTAGQTPASYYNLSGVAAQQLSVVAGNSTPVTVNITAEGDLNLDTVKSVQGDVALTSTSGSIVDATKNKFTNVIANNITLSAGGTIGTLIDPLEIDSGSGGGAGVVNATAGQTINLDQTAGNLSLGSIKAGDVATISSAGTIVNGLGSSGTNLKASAAVLTAVSGIGSATSKPIETSVQQLVAAGGSGPIEVENSGSLAISNSAALAAAAGNTGVQVPAGLSATGDIGITVDAGSLSVDQNVSTAGAIDVTAAGDITVAPGVLVASTNSSVTLDATAGNVTLPALATLSGSTTPTTPTVFIESTNTGGSTVNLFGTLKGTGAEIKTGGSDNTINLNNLPSIPLTVDGGDGGTGSNNALYITGTTGNDTFTITGSQVTVAPTGVSTQAGASPVIINYSDIQLMEVDDPNGNPGGNDTFDVTGTSAATTLDGGPGNATLNLYASPTGSAAPNAPVMFIEGAGQNTVTVTGSGQTNSPGGDDPIVLASIPPRRLTRTLRHWSARDCSSRSAIPPRPAPRPRSTSRST